MRVSLILGECREEIYKQKKEVPKAHRDIFVEIMEVRVISEKVERRGESLYHGRNGRDNDTFCYLAVEEKANQA